MPVTTRPSRLFRQLLSAPAILARGERVEPGDYIAAELLRHVGTAERQRLGPVLTLAQMARATGYEPDEAQLVVRASPAAAIVDAARVVAPRIGVAVVGEDLAAAEETARLAERTAHCDVVTAVGPEAEAVLRKLGVRWLAIVRSGTPLGTGWLAEAFDRWPSFGLAAHGTPTADVILVRLSSDPYGPPAIVVGPNARAEVEAALAEWDVVALVEPGAWTSPGWVDACCAAMKHAGAPAAAPIHNVGEPCSLPMAGDPGPPVQRLPGGVNVRDVALALRGAALPPELGSPTHASAIVLSRALAEALLRAEPLNLASCVTAMDAFLWREDDTPGPLVALLQPLDPPAPQVDRHAWGRASAAARRAVSESRPRGLPVALYSANVGPWGGVWVLLRLADELQALGIAATVVHHTTTAHRYRSQTSPLKVRSKEALIGDFPGHTGWRDGIIVASHWGSGEAVHEIVRANPGVIPTTFLQDREDTFEGRDGRPVVGMARGYREYLEIGRGVAVSRWIIDTAREDLGLKGEYEVISPGVDTSLFRPSPRAALQTPAQTPVRILAMWRPQTDVRRGIRLLRATYEALHSRFGARVSLEVFGWNERDGVGRAPDFVKHHGHLAPHQVAELMAEVDVVVEPSASQGLGLPGLEAMASGAALVSTACRGPEEYILNGENALMVPHAELADAVARVVEDAPLRRRLRAAGPETAARFDWRLVGARWAVYLADLWAEHGSQPLHNAAVERARDAALAVLETAPKEQPCR